MHWTLALLLQMLMRGILFLLLCSCLTLLDLPNWALIVFCAAFLIGTAGFFIASAYFADKDKREPPPAPPSLDQSPPAPLGKPTTTYSTMSH
jgi:hypothetical protein